VSNAENRAKTKWNAEHFKQVKVSIDPIIATAFKAACEKTGRSMAGMLSRFMAEYSNAAKKSKPAAVDTMSTRRKRRKSVSALIFQMEQIRDAEILYQSNIPENLRNSSRYEDAEQSISVMDEVIELLSEIY
jgi:hypothetical protein